MQIIHWKLQLKKLEDLKQWDAAIEFMKQIIKENPDDMDAYLCMNYLLINLLGQEDYDETKDQYYCDLAKHYFDESYAKFCDNAEYLYLTGKMAVMGEWFFGIEQEDYEAMIEKSKKLDPNNVTYKESFYWDLYEKDPTSLELMKYCKLILSENSPVKAQLKTKGALGEYIMGMKENWCKNIMFDKNDPIN